MSQSVHDPDTRTLDPAPEARRSLALPPRTVAIALGTLTATIAGAGFISVEHPVGVAAKFVGAAILAGIVPGMCITLLTRHKPALTLLELVGCGLAVSLGLVHLLTVGAVLIGVGPGLTIAVLAAGSFVAALWLFQRAGSAPAVLIRLDEGVIAALIGGLAVFLYLQGSPVDPLEDQVHVAIVSRLAGLSQPALDTIYFAPGIVYTYPFPSIHYFMALVATLADIDAVFVFHKLRFFWGPSAIVLLHLAAYAVFEKRAVAAAVTASAMALVVSGVFTSVPTFWWAQLVPLSHASDVAQNVVMPALLAMAFHALRATAPRERAFLTSAGLLLVFMLTVVHIREVVQFAAYLGCFLVVTLAFRAHRPYARRTALWLAATLAISAGYIGWQRVAVGHVTSFVSEGRDRLTAAVAHVSLYDLAFAPASELLEGFVQRTDAFFYGVTPFILFAGPAVILVFRRAPLVWLMSASTLAYLLVLSVPLLAFPYIYVTYGEILFTPVRNVIFFVYMLTGAFAYCVVVALFRFRGQLLTPFLAGAALGLIALLTVICVNQSHVGFFAPLIVAYALTFLWVDDAEPQRRWGWLRTATALGAACLALAMLFPERQALAEPAPRVSIRWVSTLDEAARGEMERRFSLTAAERSDDVSVNAWTYRLLDKSRDNVRALVGHPDVADTHYIDRETFEVEREQPRLDNPALGQQYLRFIQYPGTFLLIGTSACVGILGLFVPLALGRWPRLADAFRTPARSTTLPATRYAIALLLFIVPFALWSCRPLRSPVALTPMPPFGPAHTPQAMLTPSRCTERKNVSVPFSEDAVGQVLTLPTVTSCIPSYPVVRWVHDNVPAEAIFAFNRWSTYMPTAFMPQQVVVYPSFDNSTIVNELAVFSGYYRFYLESLRERGTQPFFNTVEPDASRVAFLGTLGVTHVLVDPPYYQDMSTLLDGLPAMFERQYADGEWAVYKVNGSAQPGSTAHADRD